MRELDLLSYVYGVSTGLGKGVTLGPGDDMGAVKVGVKAGSEEIFVTVDQVADGVHVDLQTMTVEQVGRKTMMRNLSDVAAMGAWPVGAVAAVCLPRDFGEDRAKALFDAMRKAGAEYDCPLFGGDISMWDGKLLCSITVLARCERGIDGAKLRSGAKVGDSIYVTGELGGSLEKMEQKNEHECGGGMAHHYDFEPRIEVGRLLAATAGVHAMIDISDGVAKDMAAICRMSKVAAIIDADRLPVSAGAIQASDRDGIEPWRHAAGDGEDYELLFTAAHGSVDEEIAGVKVTRIGEVVQVKEDDNRLVLFRLADGSQVDGATLGWEHRS